MSYIKICPQCGAIAEYSAYYDRITCTRCSWESDKQSNKQKVVRVPFIGGD